MAINVSQALIICSSSLVVAVVTGVGTLRLFAAEVPIAHQATWRHHRLSQQIDHPWAPQDPKKTYPATVPTVAEVVT